jgi:hypothetical protein
LRKLMVHNFMARKLYLEKKSQS